MMRSTALAVTLLSSLCLSQTHKCDWRANGIGSGDMSGGAYRCGSTAGQTAVGVMTGTSYQAFIGFWQIEEEVGVQEEAKWPSAQVLRTRMEAPAPNPVRSRVAIRYTLDAERQTRLKVHDLTGRAVRTLCASSMKRGAYSVTWDGRDTRGRAVADGVYFLKFTAGDVRQTAKLVVQR